MMNEKRAKVGVLQTVIRVGHLYFFNHRDHTAQVSHLSRLHASATLRQLCEESRRQAREKWHLEAEF